MRRFSSATPTLVLALACPVAAQQEVDLEALKQEAMQDVDGTPRTECCPHRSSPSVLADPEQALDPPAIKADDNLTVNNGDWGCPEPQLQ